MTKNRKPTAEELVETAHAAVEGIKDAAVREARQHLGQELEDHLLCPSGRKGYGGTSPDEAVLELLADEQWGAVPRLTAVLERFTAAGEVSEDFRAGLLLAARLVADEGYEY